MKYHDVFARQRLDVGINHDFKVKLTPEHDKPIYAQSLPKPINLKDDLTVELASMQYYGLITTLPYSKYSSPIFAQKKPKGKLRILIDLRRISYLLYTTMTKTTPLSLLLRTQRHIWPDIPRENRLCLQMADTESSQLLAFNFASRT